jgi:hypothetical protein
LQELDRHRHEFPFEAVGEIAAAVKRWLEAGGGRPALGDPGELQNAVGRVSEYQEFQPHRCERRRINRTLRAVGQKVAL